jgi:hypothetical protein
MWEPEKLIAEMKRQIGELERAIEQMKFGRLGAGGKTLGTDTEESLREAEARLAKLKRELAELEKGR